MRLMARLDHVLLKNIGKSHSTNYACEVIMKRLNFLLSV